MGLWHRIDLKVSRQGTPPLLTCRARSNGYPATGAGTGAEPKSAPQDAGVGRADWIWAWSMVHSRSFRDGNHHHLVVPGVDLANHSFSPSASVRYGSELQGAALCCFCQQDS